MNGYDVIIIVALAVAAIAAAVYCVRRRRQGKCIGCSGDCSSCPHKAFDKIPK